MTGTTKKKNNNTPDNLYKTESDNYENSLRDSCEEAIILPGPLSRRPSFSSFYPAISLAIIIIFFSRIISNTQYADLLWVSRDAIYIHREYWRLITALFVHSDALHLISNLPLLILFGIFLYEYFGFFIFPQMSLLIGILTNMLTLYFYQESTRLIGASGMIYGMVSLWLVLYIYHDTDRSIMMRIFRATGFALIMLFPETYNPSTSYLAHASGFVIGIITGLLILPFAKVRTV